MRRWLVFSLLLLAGGALTWSCSGMRSTGGAGASTEKAAVEPSAPYTFLAVTADCRGEMFPCG